MFKKRLPQKKRKQFFSSEETPKAQIKEIGEQDVIRSEWSYLTRYFVRFIKTKVLNEDEDIICEGIENMADLYEEIAKYIHGYIFQNKKEMVFVDEQDRELFKFSFPTVDMILVEIVSKAKKKNGNQIYYIFNSKREEEIGTEEESS
jgi:hypothetical protein